MTILQYYEIDVQGLQSILQCESFDGSDTPKFLFEKRGLDVIVPIFKKLSLERKVNIVYIWLPTKLGVVHHIGCIYYG